MHAHTHPHLYTHMYANTNTYKYTLEKKTAVHIGTYLWCWHSGGRSRQFEASLVLRFRPGKVRCYTVRFYLRKKRSSCLSPSYQFQSIIAVWDLSSPFQAISCLCFLRQTLAGLEPCRLAWTQTQRFAYRCLPSVGLSYVPPPLAFLIT